MTNDQTESAAPTALDAGTRTSISVRIASGPESEGARNRQFWDPGGPEGRGSEFRDFSFIGLLCHAWQGMGATMMLGDRAGTDAGNLWGLCRLGSTPSSSSA